MFSASEVAFSGFRAGREHFRTILVWIPILAIISFAMSAGMVSMAGPSLAKMAAMGPQAETDPQAAMEALRPLGQMYAVLLPLLLLYYGVLYGAVNRMMLRPSDKRLAYFALGADELRQIAVMILTGLVFAGIYIGGIIGVVALIAAAAVIGKALAPLAGIVGGIALLCFMVVLLVRLSLASAQTFATRKVNLFGSWALTRGRFWSMLGAYILAFILMVIAYAAVFAIVMLVMVLVGGGFSAMGAVFSPDFTSLQSFFTPKFLIYQLLVAVPAPFLLLILMCPAPEIYRSLVGAGGQASTFD